MRKSIHTRDYAVFLEVLTKFRHRSGLTQAQLGQQLPFEQPAISKIERGERRVDIIELKMICECLGVSLQEFITELQENLAKKNAK